MAILEFHCFTKKKNRKNPYLEFGYHIRSLDESLCTPFNWFTILFLFAAQTLPQIWVTIILPFGRDNVLCSITSFFPQVKVESSAIFPLGCFEAMTRKLNCTLLGFQFQVHTVQIRILIEWDVKLNSQNQQRSCHFSSQWYITFVTTTLMNAMYSKVQVLFIAGANIW